MEEVLRAVGVNIARCKLDDHGTLRTAKRKPGDVSRQPFGMKVWLEHVLRFEEDSFTVSGEAQYRPGM